MTLGKKPLTSKPGEFYGKCNLLVDERAGEKAGRCGGFETTDKAAWEAHLKTEHPKRRWDMFRVASERPLSGRRWLPPKLKSEGQPFVDRNDLTHTCEACGEVVEIPLANRHAAECTGEKVGAA